MKQIGVAKFKEQCLSLLENLDPDGIVISKRGKPIARVIPIRAASAELIGSLRGKLEPTGDLYSTGVRWRAQP